MYGFKICVNCQMCPLKSNTKFWTHTPLYRHFKWSGLKFPETFDNSLPSIRKLGMQDKCHCCKLRFVYSLYFLGHKHSKRQYLQVRGIWNAISTADPVVTWRKPTKTIGFVILIPGILLRRQIPRLTSITRCSMVRTGAARGPGPSATWSCRNNLSQWERSFHWKLRCHWLEFLRQRQIAVVRQGPVAWNTLTTKKV